ncbi:MAG: TrbI/VirB10 family protein [Gammaproteobacteria bacterium]|nr:MAG: TrbI/VirB10 family protein [Gammaproteobacteria bacterium]
MVMFKNDNVSSTSSATPVVTISNAKKWQARLFLVVSVSLVLGGLYFRHFSKVDIKPPEEDTSTATNVAAPQLSPIQQEINQIKSDIATQQTAIAIDHRENEEAEKLEKMRMVASTTVYSSSGTTGASQATNQVNASQSNNGVLGGNGGGDANTQFMSHVSDSSTPTATATRMEHPETTLAQGTMITATLEARIASDLPGMIRAVTSEDIYSEDGSLVLLPKGSRLIGQYTNAISQGQQRVFVIWQRVIRPDHISIQINSPGTDTLGGAGIGADSIDHHFIEQFGNASLLSIIGAGAANIGVDAQDQFNSASAYREALADSFAQTAQNTLRSRGVINPTLYINQGKPISVFVARDLDFYSALTTR